MINIVFKTYCRYVKIMNQILVTRNEIYRKKHFFIFQLIISIIVVLAIIYFIFHHFYNISKQEKLSNQIMNNYSLSRLYANISNNSLESENAENSNELFGIIEIPKINLSYPVFNNLTEELLKISPCKFYGSTLNENGNICIAGHNYDNGKFFSNISMLQSNDEIYIYYENIKYTYTVTSNYEVLSNNLSPIFNYEKDKKLLTLVTCNNFNDNRIIIKAYQNERTKM